MEDHSHHTEAKSNKREYLKFAGVLTGITLISLLLAFNDGLLNIMEWMGMFMGVFFVVFAGFKSIGYRMFVEMFAGYDVIAKRLKSYAYAYPFIELALGLMYLFDLAPVIRDFVTLAVMSVGAVGVVGEIRRRSGVHCACLGNVIRLPLSTVSFIEDVGMGLMALAMIIARA